jgi:hypothetical protein
MNWNIKDLGESIEKLAANKLDQSLINSYNKFWGTYIGHHKGAPIPIAGINNDDDRIRLKLGQWCYSLLQNQLFLTLIKVPKSIKAKEFEKVANSIRVFVESTHHIYNSIELVENFNEDFPFFRINVSSLSGFKNFRNILAHNVRPLIKVKTELMVPKNFSVFSDSKADDRWIWTLDSYKFKDVEYCALSEYINFTSENNRHLTFSLLEKSTEILNEQIAGKAIDKPKINWYSSDSGFVSGSEEVHIS